MLWHVSGKQIPFSIRILHICLVLLLSIGNKIILGNTNIICLDIRTSATNIQGVIELTTHNGLFDCILKLTKLVNVCDATVTHLVLKIHVKIRPNVFISPNVQCIHYNVSQK
jgi:hypothetical protein